METYHGHVRTPTDAIILFEACRIGLLPRVQRRLSEKERQSIRSGSIFVWDEREAGMRRWTDGKSWSASRVSGSFLTYREMEGKRGGNSLSAPLYSGNKKDGKDAQDQSEDGPDGYRYKPDGLMKQSFSITTSSGQHLHLISYYSRTALGSQNLTQPSNDNSLRHIRPEKGMYPESTVQDQNSIPAVTRGPMTSPGFAASPHQSVNLGSPYARSAPPGSAYHTGYPQPGWAPPSPMHTPPQHYAPYHPGGYGQPPPQQQQQHVGQSPLQQMHYPTYNQQHQPRPQTAFDRAPAPLSNSSLPPPPPPPQQYQQYPQHHQHLPPAQPQHSYPPHPQHAPSYPPPPPRYDSYPTHQMPPPAIDPKLSAAEEPRHDSVNPKHESRIGARKPSPPSTSNAQTIPSIHSLINDAQAASEERARGGSHSPNGPSAQRPQDIPLHRIGFNPHNDARALRDLDKATFRA
ncbi:hypothetical protein MBLNU457_7311t2 [Dothideomycetes sp. NU457]